MCVALSPSKSMRRVKTKTNKQRAGCAYIHVDAVKLEVCTLPRLDVDRKRLAVPPDTAQRVACVPLTWRDCCIKWTASAFLVPKCDVGVVKEAAIRGKWRRRRRWRWRRRWRCVRSNIVASTRAEAGGINNVAVSVRFASRFTLRFGSIAAKAFYPDGYNVRA